MPGGGGDEILTKNSCRWGEAESPQALSRWRAGIGIPGALGVVLSQHGRQIGESVRSSA